MEHNSPNVFVYLVDDEFAVRDALELLIKTSGWSVKSFDCAQDFLNNYFQEIPGCLILDVKMPVMGGLELQEELIKRNINIPIIFISGNADIPDSAKAFRAGAVDFLEKPFEKSILLDRIDEAVQKDIKTRQQLLEKTSIQDCFNRLTTREKEVLQLIVNSHSNKEAAKILDVSPRTIDAHRARVMEKMQADNVAALVTMVMSYELLNKTFAPGDIQ